ncbi:MAG TPA: hypothetical protein VHK69_17200, partial [Chitinophagaceae bacterium]|nr:hypothetical protein [Chitinophagaceae bacterium]
ITGKEVLKLLPAKMMDQSPNSVNDNVSGASGYFGVMIHRDYGPETKQIELDVLGNSPMLAGINTLLSLPLIGNNADQKVIRIAGYKALVQRQSGENNTYNYEVSLPINNNLITLKAPGYSQDEVIKMANSLPVAEIAKMMQ